VFWLGKAYASQGITGGQRPVCAFAQGLPSSPRCLEAALGEASARPPWRGRGGEWHDDRAAAGDERVFQAVASTNAAQES